MMEAGDDPVGPVTMFELDGAGARPLASAPSLSAASAQLPAGSYTTLRTYGSHSALRLGQHLRRLEESASWQGRLGELDEARVRRGLAAALAASGHPQSRFRLTFAPPRLFVCVEPFVPLPRRLYEEGVACVSVEVRRDVPHAKDTRFIATVTDIYRRLPPGVEEGLLLGADGAILEGLSSNFFALLEGVLQTEEERALLGTTRSLVLEVARGLVPVSLRAVREDQLDAPAEAFITSVSREVLPVARIDSRPIGDGRPGPVTRAIMEGFAALVRREAEPL